MSENQPIPVETENIFKKRMQANACANVLLDILSDGDEQDFNDAKELVRYAEYILYRKRK